MTNEADKPSVEGLMTLADAYVVAASGDTAVARHKYSTLRAELRAYAERLASEAAPARSFHVADGQRHRELAAESHAAPAAQGEKT